MNLLDTIARIANTTCLLDIYGHLRQQMTGSQMAILLYHRVSPDLENWSFPPIRPAAFEKHLVYLLKNFSVLSLLELSALLKDGMPLPKKTAVITFDDGYKDNFQYAYPLLKKYGLTATFFISTKLIGKDELFWWDKVGYLIKHTGKKYLELPDLGVVDLSRTPKLKTVDSIRRSLKKLPEAKKQELIYHLEKTTEVTIPSEKTKEAILTWREVQEMSAGGAEFGSHGQTHAILPNLPLPEAENEIVNSKKEIEENIQKPILSFSYPNGDFTSDLGKIVKNSGYDCAAITQGKMIKSNVNLFEIPRISGFEDFNRFKMNVSGLYPDIMGYINVIFDR